MNYIELSSRVQSYALTADSLVARDRSQQPSQRGGPPAADSAGAPRRR